METPPNPTANAPGDVCPHCGQAVPAGGLAGWCPACLLRQGAAGDTGFPNTFSAPAIEDLAALFPQLEILGLIGAGGMGAVYQARQRELDRVVALKILPPGIGERPGFAERFTREAKALAKLNHPGIVTIHDTGRVDGLYYLLMEYVDGPNLRQVIESRSMSPREALSIVPMICDALQYAHDAGIVHRDIKPENILIDRQGRVKVADFGLAKLIGSDDADFPGAMPADAGVTEAGQLMGTPQYMAPEQFEHPTEVDHRADIYSLGVVLYQMLTGEMPGPVLEPPSRKVEVDVRLDEVVLRALEKDPERRYQQVSQVKESVETILAPIITSQPQGEPAMEIKFSCPNCQQKLSVEEAAAGSEVSCPRCSQAMLVPSPSLANSPRPNIPNIPKLPASQQRAQPGRNLPPALPTSSPKQAHALAIWSLVLAGIGLIPLIGLATGAIGLVLGIVALAKGTTSKGLAVTGTILGCLAALMIPFHLKLAKVSMAAGKFAMGTTQCVANLVVIGNGISKYRDNNNGMYPPTLETLAKEGLLDEKVLRCPANDGKSGYEYARPAGPDATGLLVWDRAPHRALGNEVSGRNALNTEFQVSFLTEQQFRAATKATSRNVPPTPNPRPRPPVAESPNIKPRPESTPKVIPPPPKPATVETNLAALAEAAPRDKKPFLQFLARTTPTPDQRETVIAAVKPLLNDVDCGDPAFEAFTIWAGPEQVPDLMEMVRVAPRSHRGREAMKLLSRMGDPRAAEPIAAAMLDFHGLRDAKAALAAMGAIAKPTLLPYFHHENGHAREAARELLRGYQATDAEILEQSIKSLGADDPWSRRSALEYLSTAKLDPQTQVKTARAVQPLVSDADNRVRETARTAMKALATKADADFLLGLTKSEDDPTRDFAFELLVQFKDARVATPLAKLLGDPHLTYRAGEKLIALGPLAEPAVIPILASDVAGTRKRAADILNKIGTSASLRPLGALTKDKDFFTRAAAETAIAAIKARTSGTNNR